MRTLDLLGGGEILSEEECWEILAAEDLGRLAVVARDKPDIFPVNFVCEGRSIIVHSNLGHKLLSSSEADVTFEVDRSNPTSKIAWSVVVHGRAKVEPSTSPGSAWAGPKVFQIRVEPVTVTGRRVLFEPRS